MLKLTSTDQMKLGNFRSVLREIVASPGICRKQIAFKTGLSSQTVTNLVKDLLDYGIVEEKAWPGKAQRGRNPIGLFFCANHFHMLTAVASSEGITVTLHSMDATVIAQKHAGLRSGEENLNALCTFSQELARQSAESGGRLMAELISVEGVVNESTCVVVRSTVLEWMQLNLKELLAPVKVPILVQNDVNLAAQYIALTDNNIENCMIVKLDNGVGSAFVLNGKILRSMNNVAGELGHVTVHTTQETRYCQCGKKNCLTQYISIPSLERRYGKSIKDFYADCHAGNSQALALMNSIAEYLVPILANLIGLLDLDSVFFIGQTAIQLSDILFSKMEKEIRSRLSSWINPNRICLIPECSILEISPLIVLDEYFTHDVDKPYLWDKV